MIESEIANDSLLIVDGYGFIFRAYYVQPPLTAPDGTPVGAIYGFTSMLLKLINDFKPKEAVIVLDSGEKNFRHSLYEKYKANRPPAPEDLVVQLKLIKEAANSLNFAVLEKSGYEADDIIASLVKRANKENKKTIIVSSDKDLMQLMSNQVMMYDASKAKFLSNADVEKKFGVGPEKVRHVQALMGDSSDNIPGASGIGPKTASSLILQFGDLDRMYENLSQIKSTSQQEKLMQSRDNVYLSWKLVGLDEDVEIDYKNNDFVWEAPDIDKIVGYLNKYGFKSLIKRSCNLFNINIDKLEVENTSNASQTKVTDTDHALCSEVLTKKDLINLLEKCDIAGECSVILEVIDKNQTLYISFQNELYKNEVHKIDISRKNTKKEGDNLDLFISANDFIINDDYFAILKEFFNDSSILKVTFGLKSLVKLFGQGIKSIHDLSLMDYLLSAGMKSKTLSDILLHYIKIETEENDIAIQAQYLCVVFNNIKQLLIREHLYGLYFNLDLPICYIISQMEDDGIEIDIDALKILSNEFAKKISILESDIFKEANEEFNIASTKQLAVILFEKLKLPHGAKSGKSGAFSTSSEILEKISIDGHRIADLLLQHRHLSKLKNTYTDSIPKVVDPKTSRIHTTFLQNQTATSRFSSKDPNVQNIPVRTQEGNNIRSCFVSSRGYKLISADYSQIELRILSHIANIDVLQDAFKHEVDIHTRTASQIFGVDIENVNSDLRRKAKAINFGIIYGISAFGLAKQLGVSRNDASEYINRYLREYPGIKEFMDQTIMFAKEHGYVKNLLGRRCYIPAINNKNRALSSYAERAAINAPLQSLNADIVKIAMINCNKLFKKKEMKTKMLLQIHDELIFESPKSEVGNAMEMIKSTMEKVITLKVPIKVDIRSGDNWKEIY